MTELHVTTAGAGPPLLLLHGFPQTHLTWRHVWPLLADRFSVVCPDLPGYGASAVPSGLSKRESADAVVALMRDLGHERFGVVGHDRGALVAFRAALDHPSAVSHLGVIDVIPTVDLWASLSGVAGVFASHLYFLAQPSDLPERLIGADPDTFFGHFFDSWLEDPEVIDPATRETYLSFLRSPEAIHAVCEDYRASAFVDADHDAADVSAGRRVQVPALAIWQDPGEAQLPFDPAAVWASWAGDLETLVLPGGHFLPEAQPAAVAAAIVRLMGRQQS